MELLQNDMTSVVVNSLTLIITLNEKLKDLVNNKISLMYFLFQPRNVMF